MINNLANIRKKRGLSVIKLAELTGLTRDAIYKMEKGEIGISKNSMPLLEKALQTTASEIYGGISRMIPIKYYPDILASAGTGCFVSSEKFETINIDDKQLAEMGIKSSYDNIVIIKVKGYSMQPTLQDNDLLFVDSSKKEIFNNKIYIINENNNLKVKRLIRESPFSNKAIVKSDNQIDGEYPPYEIDFEKMDDNFICGQVIFYCRSIE